MEGELDACKDELGDNIARCGSHVSVGCMGDAGGHSQVSGVRDQSVDSSNH